MTAAQLSRRTRSEAPTQLAPTPAAAASGANRGHENVPAHPTQRERRRRRQSPDRPLPHESMSLLWAGHLTGPR
ncbi:hypothetical protein [Arthrobacter sp. ERGS1:01]|uniref:hypothetical protein n=1 Tax=Arthrobacter sp. ERGS1:01 TaxID=1704044 RepID=UPI000ADA59D7|nr:hypothetical protein [Arthrobacter sp. ERGS1:01]